MQRCPIEGCGRQFENQLTMIEHVKRRHPAQSQQIRQKTTNEMLEKQSKITEDINKLPKMQRVIQMSKEKKGIDFQRRSSSKKRKQLVSIVQNSQIKLNEIITESRQLVDDNANSRKLLKRPSLSKKPSQQAQSSTKLPSLNQVKVKKLKLQSLNNSGITLQNPSEKLLVKNDSTLIKQSQSQMQQMYSTAPNFTHQMNKKIELIKTRGKKQDGQISKRSQSKEVKKSDDPIEVKLHKKRLSSQTMQTLVQQNDHQVQTKPVQRSGKRLLQRTSSSKNSPQVSINNNQQLSQSTFIDNTLQQEEKKKLSFQPRRKTSSKQKIQKGFSKKQKLSEDKEDLTQVKKAIRPQTAFAGIQWNQITVSIRNRPLRNLTVPQDAQTQHLYITNCQLQQLDLNQCFSLISLSLSNNNLSSFEFLRQSVNGSFENLQNLYMDHNRIMSLDSLPTYLKLKKLSLTFNQIEGLDSLIKVLAKFPILQQLDLSFNPVRKQPNYKLSVLSALKSLTKLDGMVITKFDRQLAAQYHTMYFEQLKILPLLNSPSDKFRPSTAVSINYQQSQILQAQDNPYSQLTQQQLEKEIEMLEKMIKTTKQQYEIIQQENNVLEEQIQSFEGQLKKQEKDEQFNPKLYQKLCKQVEELEMLNFLQYASEKQLEDLLLKKAQQKGIPLEMLTAI